MSNKTINFVNDYKVNPNIQNDVDVLFYNSQIFENTAKTFLKPVVEPKLYCFHDDKLDEVNNFAARKLGDTIHAYVETRLNQWKEQGYPNLVKDFEHIAYVDYDGERYYFRDYLVHQLLRERGYVQLFAGTSGNETYDNVIIPDTITAPQLSVEFYVLKENPKQPLSKSIIEEIYKEIEESVINGNTKFALSTSHSKHTYEKDFTKESPWSFSPYDYQTKAINSIVDNLIREQNGNKRVLLDAPTRSGKTPTVLWSVKNFLNQYAPKEKHTVVITTAIVDVLMEFKETIQRHVDFRDKIVFLDREFIRTKAALGQDAIVEAYKDYDIVITGVSLQDLAGRVEDGTLKHIHNGLKNKVSLVVGDECHVGMFGSGEVYREAVTETTKQERNEAIKEKETLREVFSLNPKYGFIFASATTYNILGTSAFNEDAITFISQKDVDNVAESVNKKFIDKDGNDQNSPYFGKPNKHFFAIMGTGVDVTLNELMKANKKGEFIHQEAAYAYLDSYFGLVNNEQVPPLFASEVLKEAGAGRHILIAMPSKVSCDAIEKYFIKRKEDYPELFDQKVINISSTRDTGFTAKNATDIKDFLHVNRFNRTITITVNRLTTGVSVPQWDTLLLLSAGKSLTRRVQVYGRPTTSWVESVDFTNDDGTVEKVKFCMKPNSFVIDGDGGQVYEIANDVEIHSHILSKKKNNEDDSKNLDNSDYTDNDPVIGNIVAFDGVSLKRMSRLDIHRQLDDYIKDKRVSEIVDSIPFDEYIDNNFSAKEFDNFFKTITIKKNTPIKVKLTEEQESLFDRFFNDEINSGEDFIENNDDINNDDVIEDDNNNDVIEDLSKQRAFFQKQIKEKIMLFALLQGKVESLTEIAELCNKFDNGTINETDSRILINVGFDSVLYRRVVRLFAKNYLIVDAMERGIKSIRAKCLDDNGNFSVTGFLTVVEGLSRLSPNEVFTPNKAAALLVDKLELSSEDFKSFEKDGFGIIDVGCKSGVILLEFMERAIISGINEELLKDKIFAVPTSPLAFEFVRCVFDNSGWNTDHIFYCEQLSNLDIVTLIAEAIKMKDADDNNVENNKVFINIVDKIESITDKCVVTDFWKGLFLMVKKFDYCISNPPYQQETTNDRIKNNTRNIFNVFQKYALDMAHRTAMIYPAGRWWYRESNFRNSLLNNQRLRSVTFYNVVESLKIFPQAEITDGIAVVIVDDEKSINKRNTFELLNVNGDKINIPYFTEGIVPIDVLDAKLWQKILNFSNTFIGDKKMTLRNEIKMTGAQISKIIGEEVSADYNPKNNEIKLYANATGTMSGKSKYYIISKDKTENFMGKYRVGVRQNIFEDARKKYTVIPIDNKTTFGRSLVSIAEFDVRDEWINFIQYANTRFFEKLFRMSSIGREKNACVFVPDLEDYTNNNDLFKTDDELTKDHKYYGLNLDERLYKLFDLTDDEIAIVEG